MTQTFTAIYKKSGKLHLGWIEEIPGVNTQGKTLKETKVNLKEALSLVLEVNRAMMKKDLKGKFVRQPMTVDI